MEYLISKNSDGELLGFDPVDSNPKIPETADPCRVFTAEVVSADVLNADAREVYWLYEVCFSDFSSVFVTAFQFSDALVTALLYIEKRAIPFYIHEYDLFELREDGKSAITSYKLDDSLNSLFELLNLKNRDLVAHAIACNFGYTEDELKRLEADNIAKALGVSGRLGLDLTTDEILRACSYIWNNYILLEATDASMEVRRLHARHSADTDATSLLTWTFVFEEWAHYDCHLPYTLRRLLLDGGLDVYLDALHNERKILE